MALLMCSLLLWRLACHSLCSRAGYILECFLVQGTQQQPQQPQQPQLPPSLAELYPHLLPRPAQHAKELPPPAAVSVIQHQALQLNLVLMRLILRTIQLLPTVTYLSLHGLGIDCSLISGLAGVLLGGKNSRAGTDS